MSSLDAIKNFRFTKKQFIVVYYLVMLFTIVSFLGDYYFFKVEKENIYKELTNLLVSAYLIYLFYFQVKDYLMGYLVLHVIYMALVDILYVLGKLSAWYFIGIIMLAGVGVLLIKRMGSSCQP